MAGITQAPAALQIVRQGNKLIIPAPLPGQAAPLPPLCVKCTAAAEGQPLTKLLSWHHPALYVLLIWPIIYVIVALIVRKNMKLQIPLCALHRKRRSIAVTLSWVLPVIGVADGFILPRFNVDGGVVALVVVACLIAGLVIWAVVGSVLRPVLIDSTRGEFTGFCPTFLEQFPDVAAAMPFPQAGLPSPPIQ